MLATLRYPGPSAVEVAGGVTALHFAPNLARDPTHLVAILRDPLVFRDAMLALHDVARSEYFVSPEEIEGRILDPVITVAPELVCFEAFSLDESTYGRVMLRAEAFREIESWTPGTTNVEFSRDFRAGLETLRGRSLVTLRVAPEGFRMSAEAAQVDECKIDIPDSWVHGFVSVQAASGRSAVTLALHPGDLRNLVQYLRARKEAVSPRSLRFQMAPRCPPRVIVEPWDETIVFERSTHDFEGKEDPREIRVWGRRRLLLLAQALPAARGVRVQLLGTGLPSFWTVDCGSAALTLGLSPWCERDWATMEPFPLDTPACDPGDVERAALTLAEQRRATPAALAALAGGSVDTMRHALDILVREGRALHDVDTGTFVARRLFETAPPPPAASQGRREAAQAILAKRGVTVVLREELSGHTHVTARVEGRGTYDVMAVVDASGALMRGACACPYFAKMGFARGACKHLLALELQTMLSGSGPPTTQSTRYRRR